MGDKNFGLVMPFYDQSESFTNGFECGVLWNKMENGEDIGSGVPVHTCNIPQIKLMCDHFGYAVVFEVQLDPLVEWTSIRTITRIQIPGPAKSIR